MSVFICNSSLVLLWKTIDPSLCRVHHSIRFYHISLRWKALQHKKRAF